MITIKNTIIAEIYKLIDERKYDDAVWLDGGNDEENVSIILEKYNNLRKTHEKYKRRKMFRV